LLLHAYSYLFHFALASLLFGVALVGKITGTTSFDLQMVPWYSGKEQIPFLLIATVIGLLSIVLSAMGKVRFLFALWTAFILVSMVWGFFFGPYHFEGEDEFKNALWLTGGAVLAFLGGLSQLRPLPTGRTRKR
jgi:hypothetical protein